MSFDSIKPTLNTANLNTASKQLGALLKSPITEAAKAYVEADINVTPGSVSYAVMKQEGTFARVNVFAKEGGGYALILKKVYELWVVVVAGQDLPGKAVGEKYGLPAGWYSLDY